MASASGQRFSTFASKFLNQSLLPTNASTTMNEPLFYSMAEDSYEGDDSQDPHLQRSRGAGQQEYDPFNLEDIPDDEREDGAGMDASLGDAQDSLPLLLQSNWRQTQRQPQRQAKSPSPESSLSSSNDSLPLGLEMFEDDRPPQRTTLTESLLPRNHDAPFVFNLPVPGRIPRRKYNDAGWANLWYVCVAICAIGSILTLFLTHVRFTFYHSFCEKCSFFLLETYLFPRAPPIFNIDSYHPSHHALHNHIGIYLLFDHCSSSICRQTRLNGHLCRSANGYDNRCRLGICRQLHLDRKGRWMG